MKGGGGGDISPLPNRTYGHSGWIQACIEQTSHKETLVGELIKNQISYDQYFLIRILNKYPPSFTDML